MASYSMKKETSFKKFFHLFMWKISLLKTYNINFINEFIDCKSHTTFLIIENVSNLSFPLRVHNHTFFLIRRATLIVTHIHSSVFVAQRHDTFDITIQACKRPVKKKNNLRRARHLKELSSELW